MPLLFPVVAQVLFLTKDFGIYIHIPFCKSKCNYCNFYSFCADNSKKEEYIDALCRDITAKGEKIDRTVTSVYFGGGTPTVLSAKQLCRLLECVRKSFTLSPEAEITIEANPGDNLEYTLPHLKASGFNRISFGVQSANDDELLTLGRRHTTEDAKTAVSFARKCGFENISLDLMLGLPNGNIEKLKNTLENLCDLSPEHISAYILKAEKGTPLFDIADTLPCDDEVAEQYLFVCDFLKGKGYSHYEISNFSKEGFESRHNTLYWKCGEYLGFGPSAHSYFGSKRFFYQNDIDSYLLAPKPVYDGLGGTAEEYILLSLRLSSGIDIKTLENRFQLSTKGLLEKAVLYEKNGLCRICGEHISLTDSGMLVSNTIITSFLEEFDL